MQLSPTQSPSKRWRRTINLPVLDLASGVPDISGQAQQVESVRDLINETQKLADDIGSFLVSNRRQDTYEFYHTAHFASIIIGSVCRDVLKNEMTPPPYIISSADKIRKIYHSLQAFLEELKRLPSEGLLKRFVGSTRNRKEFDLLQSSLWEQLHGLEDIRLKSHIANIDEDLLESKGSKIMDRERQFHDLRAKTFWLRSFRENTMFVGIDLFLCNFERHIDVDMSPQDVANLLFVLDYSNTGLISLGAFRRFNTWFGPFKQCIVQLRATMAASWFCRFLSCQTALYILKNNPVGAFVVFIDTVSGVGISIAYNHQDSGTRVVRAIFEGDAYVVPEYNQQLRRLVRRRFESLHSIFIHYSHLLQRPVHHDTLSTSYVHYDLLPDDVEDLLGQEKCGSFLVTYSTTCKQTDPVDSEIVLSHVDPNEDIQHQYFAYLTDRTLARRGHASMRREVFPSLEEAVASDPQKWQYPVTKHHLIADAWLDTVYGNPVEVESAFLDAMASSAQQADGVVDPPHTSATLQFVCASLLAESRFINDFRKKATEKLYLRRLDQTQELLRSILSTSVDAKQWQSSDSSLTTVNSIPVGDTVDIDVESGFMESSEARAAPFALFSSDGDTSIGGEEEDDSPEDDFSHSTTITANANSPLFKLLAESSGANGEDRGPAVAVGESIPVEFELPL